MKINGVTHYLWRAVDHEGEVLESVVTKTRDRKAVLKFLRACCGHFDSRFPCGLICDSLCLWQMLGVTDG